jgi:CRP/FNR family cyclic AMP-dependent transcriptional regulator
MERFIKKDPFLEGMSPHQHRLLSDCAMPCRFQAGEVIFREGDPANGFYLLQKGKVVLESYVLGRGIVPLQTIVAGEVLGWSWLFPPCFWHFGARAVEPTEAIFIYGTPLREECEFDHDLGYELFKRMAGVMLERLHAARRQSLGLARTLLKGL